MSEPSHVKLQAENIDLRTQLDAATNRLEKLHQIVMKTADVHVLADELDGTATDDEFFALLKKKVRHAKTEAEKEGKLGMVPMEDFEAIDQELQQALEREQELRGKVDSQSHDLRVAKTDARKAAEQVRTLERKLNDLQVECTVLQEAVDELTADEARRTPRGSPPPPPPPPGPTPATTTESGPASAALQEKLRKAQDAADKAEAERKIALQVKERALKEAAQALTENARLQGIINGSREGSESAAQLLAKTRKDELDETREMLILAEKRNTALQKRVGDAENDLLEARATVRDLEADLAEASKGPGGAKLGLAASSSLERRGRPTIDLQELLLPPAPPPRADGDDEPSAAAASSPSLPPVPIDLATMRARLLTRARAVPLEPGVFEAAVGSLQTTYRKLTAEVRLQDAGNLTAQHACLLDGLLDKEIQLQQLHSVLQSLETSFGTRLASKEAEASAYYARAIVAEGRLSDLKRSAHDLHLKLADTVESGGGGGASVGFLQGAASPQADGASPGAETANRAAGLLHSIAELNGLLASFEGPKPGTTAAAQTADASSSSTPQRQLFGTSAGVGTDSSPLDAGAGTAEPSPGSGSRPSLSAARHSQRTVDLMARVRARQTAKHQRAAEAASTFASTSKGTAADQAMVHASPPSARHGASAAGGSSLSASSSPAGGVGAGIETDQLDVDDAVRRAVPVAEHLQQLILSSVKASSPSLPGTADPASPSPGGMATANAAGDDAAAQAAAEEVLATLADKEAEIARLEARVKSQQTLISLLKNSLSAAGGGVAADAGSISASSSAGGAASPPGVRGHMHHADPMATLSSSPGGASGSLGNLEELASAQTQLKAAQARVDAMAKERDELRAQLGSVRLLASEEADAAAGRLALSEARTGQLLSQVEQREGERDRALATGKRLEAAVQRRNERAALGRLGSVIIGEDGQVSTTNTPARADSLTGSAVSTAAASPAKADAAAAAASPMLSRFASGADLNGSGGAAALQKRDSLVSLGTAGSVVITPAMDTAMFAATLRKVKPRVSVDEATAATILSEAISSYEELLDRVAEQQRQIEAKKKAATADTGVGGGPAPGTSTGTGDDFGDLAASAGGGGVLSTRQSTAVGDDGQLDPEHLHEQALLELLFDHKLKMWHVTNDYQSMRAIVDIKIEDKEQERKAAVDALNAHIKALQEQVTKLLPRVQSAEAEVDNRGRIIADMQQRLGTTPGDASAATPALAPAHYAELEKSLKEATMRIQLLKEQLVERGITPNCD